MLFHKCIAHRGLVSVKNAVESLDQFGSRLPADDIMIANDLSRSRIPAKWVALAGDNSPPDSVSLSQWLGDIGLRVAHFERILAVVSTFAGLAYFYCFKSACSILSREIVAECR